MFDSRDPEMATMLQAEKIQNIFGQHLVPYIESATEQLGVAYFYQMKSTFIKSLNDGIFSASATMTRLLSSYKIELKKYVTPGRVKHKVIIQLCCHFCIWN